ncbi:MAG: transporter substrate-binding domain-containing protein [Opitutaceae bacterium]|jgi:polar amino acid transport system substrate-binding protein
MRDILQILRACSLCWVVVAAGLLKAEDVRVKLTDVERAWVQAHPVVRFGYDPGWPPFSYRDENGTFAGIDRELLDRLADRLGLKFVPVDSRSWPEAYENAKAGGAAFLVSTSESEERAKSFVFTRPYVSFPMAIIARTDSPALRSLEQLNGRKVAVARDYVGNDTLRRDYPGIEIEVFDTLDLAFVAVSQGRADVVATNIANAHYVVRNLGLANLKVAGVMPYLFQLRYAVRRDEPVLRDILDKGVASLNLREREAIIAPWVKLDYTDIVRWDYLVRWAGALTALAALVGGLVLWRHLSLRSELEKRLRIQRDLEAAQARLERLNEEKSGLMRMAAHDLRSPLTGINLCIEMMRLESGRPSRESFDRVEGLVNQMAHMIRNLLDVEALEDGSRRLRIEPLDLAESVKETLAALRPVAERKRIVLRMEMTAHAMEALADRSALYQVIENLVSNALKYSPPETEIVVEAGGLHDGRACLRVQDQGPGIKPEEMPRLFHKYTCLSARPTGGEPSTGLGLAIVKQLVTAMGGRVWCESPAAGGACFVVELPAAAAAVV